MKTYKTINILSIVLCIAGLIFQIYNDAYIEENNDNGMLIVIAGLCLSIANEFFKEKRMKE